MFIWFPTVHLQQEYDFIMLHANVFYRHVSSGCSCHISHTLLSFT